jgi:hypothetical protein
VRLLAVSNLRLGHAEIPPNFPQQLVQHCLASGVETLVLMDVFPPSTNPRSLLEQWDCQYTLGPDGHWLQNALRLRLHWLLGQNDQFIDDPVYADLLHLLVKKGVTVCRERDTIIPDPAISHKMFMFTVGNGDLSYYHEPPVIHFWRAQRWLRRWGLTREPKIRIPWQNHALALWRLTKTAQRLHKRSEGKILGVIHAVGERQYGQHGSAWLGCPGRPPWMLEVDSDYPESGRLVRP